MIDYEKLKLAHELADKEQEEYKIANLPKNWDGMLGVSYRYFCELPHEDTLPWLILDKECK